jgi:hypothetical protein
MRKFFRILFLLVLVSLFFEAGSPFARAENICTFKGVGAEYRAKATQEELKKEPWLFGNGKGIYLLRSDKSGSGGQVKPGEKKSLTVAGYFGWDDHEGTWDRKVKYKWEIYNQKVTKEIKNDSPALSWTAPAYNPTSEAANTYTVTCWAEVKYIKSEQEKKVKEIRKEGVSWILWVEK